MQLRVSVAVLVAALNAAGHQSDLMRSLLLSLRLRKTRAKKTKTWEKPRRVDLPKNSVWLNPVTLKRPSAVLGCSSGTSTEMVTVFSTCKRFCEQGQHFT